MAERLQTLFILYREEAKNAKKNLKVLKNQRQKWGFVVFVPNCR